jgi:hypothetical protein
MKYLIIILSILVLSINAKSSDCWSEKYGYPCCPKSKVITVDKHGKWGIENGDYCGVSPYCFAEVLGYKCCEDQNGPRTSIDADGEWYEDKYGNWCGYSNSTSRWNDREKFDETRKEWEAFKKKWYKEYSKDLERLSVFVGEDESKLNFGWYSSTKSSPVIRFYTNKDKSEYKDFTGSVEYYKKINGKKYYSNKVTVTGLKRNKTYYYRRSLNGEWESSVKFKTYDPDNFNFIFVGDPQIGGASNHISVKDLYSPLTVEEGTRNDAFNWNMTVYDSFKFSREPSVYLSAGDQADTDLHRAFSSDPYKSQEEYDLDDYRQEVEYSAFLLPELLKTIPSATAVGNHDSFTENFRHHFNTPNSYLNPEYTDIIPGYNYFFKFNNVLVVVLETNYGTCDDFTNVISKAIKKYPSTDWRIAMFHHDIYGNGEYHSQDPQITEVLRPCLTKLLYRNEFDLAISGHDHVYSASHFVTYDKESEKGYAVNEIKKGNVYKNPKGTFYLTANCSTGSKLYTFIDKKPSYIYHYKQTFSSTFGILEFKKESGKVRLTINSYEVGTNKVTDGPYIFEKTANGKSNNNSEECWSLKDGYPCCKTTFTVIEVDENGKKWGFENNNWCGINGSNTSDSQCWATKYDYPCCKKTTEVIEKDEHGKWGFENNDWCGIVDSNSQTKSKCWASEFGKYFKT